MGALGKVRKDQEKVNHKGQMPLIVAEKVWKELKQDNLTTPNI
jgi:hypothetical protein